MATEPFEATTDPASEAYSEHRLLSFLTWAWSWLFLVIL